MYNSKQYYFSSYGQELLGDPELAQLNEKGKKFYSEVLENVKQDHFKGQISDADVKNRRSGVWTENTDHPYHNPDNPESVGTHLCTMGNAYISGSKDGGPISTSNLIFVTKDWVYTSSGSLYKIINYVRDYDQISNQCMKPCVYKYF
uniref:Uncharacterized protein n=1 Tax=Marseillevirus LCMAC101 TaxID=2506602 RepID=A0A481YR30_9VIRU|nr:MAG: hypothetical protein LCMAC101_01060 [Marseillevirus LCMAC101]